MITISDFADRLAKLRLQKGISSREMSLSIGQNESFINKIENKNNFPLMQSFFCICDYLGIIHEVIKEIIQKKKN